MSLKRSFSSKVALIICILISSLLSFKILLADWVDSSPVPNPEMARFDTPEMQEIVYTGDLNLTVPLLTVPGRDGLDLPLFLKYKQPIKVNQHASWVGLGWELDIGSVICAPVTYPDLTTLKVKYYESGGYQDLDSLWGTVDTTLSIDNWNLSTPFESSRLIWDVDSGMSEFNPSNWTFYPMPWRDWQISHFYNSTKSRIDSLKMVSEDGRVHLFNFPLSARWDQRFFYYYPVNSFRYISEWKLTEIRGPGGRQENKIMIEYEFDAARDTVKYCTRQEVDDYYYNYDCDDFMNYRIGYTSITYPKKIITPTHIAIFNTSDRDANNPLYYDMVVKEGDLCQYPKRSQKKLDNIELYTKDEFGGADLLIKVIKFDYDYSRKKYSQTSMGELTLKEVWIEAPNNTDKIPSYKFTYESYNPALDADNLSGYNDPRCGDWGKQQAGWGYYSSGPGDYNAGVVTARAWSLKSVVYPTGGTITYYYGSDRIKRQCSPGVGTRSLVREGGTRIDSVRVDDGMGNSSVYRYYYGKQLDYPDRPDSASYGYANVQDNLPFNVWKKELEFGGEDFLVQNPVSNNEYIGYNKVTIEYPDSSRRETRYSTSLDTLYYYDVLGNETITSVGYDSVIKLDNIGMGGMSWWGRFRTVIFSSDEFMRGLVKRVRFINSNNHLIQEVTRRYAPQIVIGRLIGGSDFVIGVNKEDSLNAGLSNMLVQAIWKEDITNEIRYEYHPVQDNDFPTLLKFKDHYSSSEEGRFTEYKYAWESVDPIGQTMKNKHMINQLGATIKGGFTVNGSVITRDTLWIHETTWDDFNPSPIKPLYEIEGLGSESVTVLSYDKYDIYGNLLKTTDGNGNKVYYYYGDNNNPFNNTADGLFHSKLTGIIKMLDKYVSPDTIIPFNDADQLANKIEYCTTLNWEYPYLPKKIFDNNEKYHWFVYDKLGRLISVMNNSNQRIEDYEYFYSRDSHPNFDPNDPNYIRIIKSRAGSSTHEDTVATYYDGLGREVQQQVKSDSASIVSEKMYDALGRLVLETKPAAITGGIGYDAGFIEGGYSPGDSMTLASGVYQYYDSNPGPDSEGYPFSFYRYEDNPLNRIFRIYPPGRDFHLESKGHYVEKAYEANTAEDNIGPPSSYYAERTKDENGIWREEWTNLFGEVVGEAIDHPNEGEGLNIVTKYAYDGAGNLIEVKHPGRYTGGFASIQEDSAHAYQTIQVINGERDTLTFTPDTAYTAVIPLNSDTLYTRVRVRIHWSRILDAFYNPCSETRYFWVLVYDGNTLLQSHYDFVTDSTGGQVTYWELDIPKAVTLNPDPEWKVKLYFEALIWECPTILRREETVRDWRGC